MKAKKLVVALTIVIAVFSAGIFGFIKICGRNNTKTRIGFYRVEENIVNSVKGVLESSQTKTNKFSFIILDDKKEVTSQTKKIDVLITNMGFAADKVVNAIPENKVNSMLFDASVIKDTSLSIASLCFSTPRSGKEKISQIPILFDNYELLLSTQTLAQSKTKDISSWTDLERYALNAKSITPNGIVFAGGDSDSLLGFISAIVESFEGKKVYNSLVETIRTYDGPMDKLLEELTLDQSKPLYETMKRLCSWKNNNFFQRELLTLSKGQFRNLMETQRTCTAALSLSEHRKIEGNIIKHYTSLPVLSNENVFFFPSMRKMNTRAVISPMVAMISLTNNKKSQQAVEILIENNAQEKLAKDTGLSPFHLHSSVSDIQSDDVRFWIASTSSPVSPLYLAAFDDDSKKEEFALAIRNFILNSK